MIIEELNRRGLAYVWGLMGLPGGLARIMIDSGNLVGDVVSEEFARQANLAGEACQKEIKTAAAGGKMQIIGRCYPVKLRIAGIGTPFEIQPWVVRGMKNAVNLGQLFLSRNNAHLTFSEGKVSLQIGGGKVYLEEKGYSGLDRRVDEAPAAARAWDRALPEAREGAWMALLSPREVRGCWDGHLGPGAGEAPATSSDLSANRTA